MAEGRAGGPPRPLRGRRSGGRSAREAEGRAGGPRRPKGGQGGAERPPGPLGQRHPGPPPPAGAGCTPPSTEGSVPEVRGQGPGSPRRPEGLCQGARPAHHPSHGAPDAA
eukprot:5457796-Pyramimonas_sp.AAC.1